MRKRFAFQMALCTIASCTVVSGLFAEPNTFHYGGQVGLTEARLTDLSALQYKFTIPMSANFPRVTVTVTGGATSFNPGIAFGGWGHYVINPNFGVELGVFFTQQGGTLKQSGSQLVFDSPGENANSMLVEYNLEHDFELRYVRLPLLGKVLIPTKHFTPFVKFGPDIGFLTSARLETSGVYSTPDLPPPSNQLVQLTGSEDFAGRFRTLGIALHFAGGVDVPVGSAAVYAEVGYSLGLSDVNEDKSDFSQGVKNSVLTFALGFFF